MRVLSCGLVVAVFGLVTAPVARAGEAVPTKIMVRAVAHDAKIIGSNVGGARITIREADTGRVLAEGVQMGKTGDTGLIMLKPRERYVPVFGTEGAAGFLATIALSKPTVVEIIAEGPLGNGESKRRASTTLLMVPGRDILGDGVVLEIHGFTVEIMEPEGPVRLRAGDDLRVRARVTMT